MKNLKLIQVILASALISGVAIAAPNTNTPQEIDLDDVGVVIPNAPSYYPVEFQRTGVVRGQEPGRGLVISGLNYFYGTNTPVHSISSKFASVGNITIGTKLGFSFVLDDLGRHLLTEIWIIPDTAIFTEETDQ